MNVADLALFGMRLVSTMATNFQSWAKRRAASADNVAGMLARGAPGKLYVVGVISTKVMAHCRISRLPISPAQQVAASAVINKTDVRVHAKLNVRNARPYSANTGKRYCMASTVVLSDCLLVQYSVGFTSDGVLDFLVVSLIDPAYSRDSHLCARIEHTWDFSASPAPPSLQVLM